MPEATEDTVRLVIDDMEERRAQGMREYGEPLQPENGRNSLQDAYEEVLDLAFYLRNELEEKVIRRQKHLRDLGRVVIERDAAREELRRLKLLLPAGLEEIEEGADDHENDCPICGDEMPCGCDTPRGPI